MKIVFISNYFNHHQKSFCDTLYKQIGNEFYFISTTPMSEERKKLGYGNWELPQYVKYSYTSEDDLYQCQKLIDEADFVLSGSAPEFMLKNRKKKRKLIIRYSERPLKKGNNILKYIPRLLKWNYRMRGKNQYMLCASAYTATDYNLFGLYKNRTYKWGYFPETYTYDIDRLVKSKNKREILWCGRFIDWKHVDDVIEIANKLKLNHYDFHITIIGTGPLEYFVRDKIRQYSLNEFVTLTGSMSPDKVRKCMEESGIYLFTSDHQEGWGAVLNESMNSGCATISSHAIGAVPFLIEHEKNGIVYKNGDVDGLYNKVRYLLDKQNEQERLGINAYHTIVDLWNGEIAAMRFLEFVKEIQKKEKCNLFVDGPCGRAEVVKNDWFHG